LFREGQQGTEPSKLNKREGSPIRFVVMISLLRTVCTDCSDSRILSFEEFGYRVAVWVIPR